MSSLSFDAMDIPVGNQTPPKIEPKYEVNAGPRFDREACLQSYSGTARFERQLYIGLHSKKNRREWLMGAYEEARREQNPHHYILAREACIHFGLLKGPGGHDAWLNNCEHKNMAEKTRLETEFRHHKQMQIKDSIRLGLEELAQFHIRCGDYKNAHDNYKKLRHFAETEQEILRVNIGIVSVNIEQKYWNDCLSNCIRLNGISGSSQLEPEAANDGMKLYGLACGLSHLALASEAESPDDKYLKAAASFLLIPAGLGDSYNQLATSNNIAMYGAVTALATMTREQLQKDCLESARFRTYLELEPRIRKAISHFINGKYAACLEIIEDYRNDFLLDVYLGEHAEKLLQMIRDRCIVNYCYPFSVVKLETLNEQFCKPGQDIVEELADLIKRGEINARIDVMASTLNTVLTPPRTEIQRQILKSVQDYEHELKRRILHMAIVNADLEVKPKKTQWVQGEGIMGTRSFHPVQGYGGYSGGGGLGQVLGGYERSSEDETFGDDDMMEQ